MPTCSLAFLPSKILSELSPAELCDVISSGNDKMLKTVKGIGLKTAQRIIVDLKDKIATSDIANELPTATGKPAVAINNEVKDEAMGALTMLGFAPAPTAKVVMDSCHTTGNTHASTKVC